MNHLTARQKGEDGGWHYVSLNRRLGGHPLGYCAGHEPHATEAEARECYAQYRRDNVTLDGKCGWTECVAEGCNKPANRLAKIRHDGYHVAPLCDEHITLNHAIKALGLDHPAGDAWKS